MLIVDESMGTYTAKKVTTVTQHKQSQLIVPFNRGQGIIIIGGSGAGKTTLAKQLSRILELPFLDSDSLIEIENNNSIANIFACHGEVGFRFLEAQTICNCITTPSIIALGAGSWENSTTREVVEQSKFAVIWLAESPELAWSRVADDRSRPMVTTYNQFLARWIKRAQAWSNATKIIPSRGSPYSLAKKLVNPLGRAYL